MRFLIVGAGQLGSRHATSLSKFGDEAEIHLVDPFELSLETAQQRILETRSLCKIFLYPDINKISGHFDFVIVATSSIQRIDAIKQLIKNVSFSRILIEKLLVPSAEDLEEFREIAIRLPRDAWVNCPMPYFPHYVSLAEKLQGSSLRYDVSGSNLGLITNAVHYLDHFLKLTGQAPTQLSFSSNTILIDSKRSGYREAVGSLEGSTISGDKISIKFSGEFDPKLQIRISNDSETWTFDEILGHGSRLLQEGNKFENFSVNTPLQSQLTYESVEAVLQGKKPKWAELSDSFVVHQVLFSAINDLVVSNYPKTNPKFT